MIFNKKTIFLILIFFLFSNFSYSKIDFQIIMKINGQIVTTFDLEKESNYLLALNQSYSATKSCAYPDSSVSRNAPPRAIDTTTDLARPTLELSHPTVPPP